MISFSAKAQRSWNMREAAKRAADVHLQNALLSSHQTYLQILDHTVQTSHAAIIKEASSCTSSLAYGHCVGVCNARV
jgi:formiminotetrahydrofolate cyclodeaminase